MSEDAEQAPDAGPRDDPRALLLLILLGAGLLLACLYMNRIALGGPLGEAPRWVEALARPVDALHTRLFGPLEEDIWRLTGQRRRVRQMVILWSAASALYLAAVWVVLGAPWRRGRYAWETILVVALCARVILVFSPPLLETDPYRYLWDGVVLTEGVNPYRYAPEEVVRYGPHARTGYTDAEHGELARLSARTHEWKVGTALGRVNHRSVPTVYPPLAQWLFALAARIDPGNIYVLKALVALLDLAIVAMLIHLLGVLGRPRELVLLYAWCPMVLEEYSQSAHYDPLATLFLLVSLALLLRGRSVLAGLALGLAVTGKFFPLLALFVLVRRYGWRGTLAALATVLAMYLPFLGIGLRMFEGLLVFGTRWIWNASLFALARAPFRGLDADPVRLPLGDWIGSARWSPPPVEVDSMLAAKALLGLIGLAGLVWLLRRPEERDEQVIGKAFGAVALLFVLSPVQNPWYCAWLMPFAALTASVAWPVLSGGMVVYYAYHLRKTYAVPAPVPGGVLDLRWLEYLPFYGLWLLELRRGYRPPRAATMAPPGA